MNEHSFRVHQWWSITISKRPVSSKNRLNLYGHSRNAVHSLFCPFVYFFLYFQKYTQKDDYHVCRYVQSNMQTCAVSLWGSNLHLVHSSTRMSRFCQCCKCRLEKRAILFSWHQLCWQQHLLHQHMLLFEHKHWKLNDFQVTSMERKKQSILFE